MYILSEIFIVLFIIFFCWLFIRTVYLGKREKIDIFIVIATIINGLITTVLYFLYYKIPLSELNFSNLMDTLRML